MQLACLYLCVGPTTLVSLCRRGLHNTSGDESDDRIEINKSYRCRFQFVSISDNLHLDGQIIDSQSITRPCRLITLSRAPPMDHVLPALMSPRLSLRLEAAETSTPGKPPPHGDGSIIPGCECSWGLVEQVFRSDLDIMFNEGDY